MPRVVAGVQHRPRRVRRRRRPDQSARQPAEQRQNRLPKRYRTRRSGDAAAPRVDGNITRSRARRGLAPLQSVARARPRARRRRARRRGRRAWVSRPWRRTSSQHVYRRQGRPRLGGCCRRCRWRCGRSGWRVPTSKWRSACPTTTAAAPAPPCPAKVGGGAHHADEERGGRSGWSATAGESAHGRARSLAGGRGWRARRAPRRGSQSNSVPRAVAMEAPVARDRAGAPAQTGGRAAPRRQTLHAGRGPPRLYRSCPSSEANNSCRAEEGRRAMLLLENTRPPLR